MVLTTHCRVRYGDGNHRVMRAAQHDAGRPSMISVVLIEDNRLVREGVSELLNQLPDIRVLAAGSSDDSLLRPHADSQVVLLDLGPATTERLRLAEAVKKAFPESKVIVMDLLPGHEDIVELVSAGVAGFLMEDATPDDLANTIRWVAKGAHILPPQMTKTLFSQIAKHAVIQRRSAVHDAVRVTPREREVISLIAEGLATKEIAARLHIAAHTVKSHVRNVMEKLMVHTRLQIAAYAHRDGAPRGSESSRAIIRGAAKVCGNPGASRPRCQAVPGHRPSAVSTNRHTPEVRPQGSGERRDLLSRVSRGPHRVSRVGSVES